MCRCNLEGKEQRSRICGYLISGEVGVAEKGVGDLNESGKAYWAGEAEKM